MSQAAQFSVRYDFCFPDEENTEVAPQNFKQFLLIIPKKKIILHQPYIYKAPK
jgi:hypothetical protein